MTAREYFSTSRAADFLQPRGLSLSMGVGPDRFLQMAVKELLDNAIDAAELGSESPRVSLEVRATDNYADVQVEDAAVEAVDITVTVTDNGPGIPADVVAKVMDFDYLTSDKAVYRSPTRGQQGNALKTVVGVASVWGGQQVVVEAGGLRHKLRAALVSNLVEVEHRQEPSELTTGTRVTLIATVRVEDGRLVHDYCPSRFVQGHALANPHVHLEVILDEAFRAPLAAALAAFEVPPQGAALGRSGRSAAAGRLRLHPEPEAARRAVHPMTKPTKRVPKHQRVGFSCGAAFASRRSDAAYCSARCAKSPT